MLEDAMGQLNQLRDQINCQECNGFGCEACCRGEFPGMGLGAGAGQGARPEADDDTAAYDSQVRPKIGKGLAVVTDLVDGPNIKGNVEEEIKQQVEAVRRGNTDPLTHRRIPRKHKEHVSEYFNRFREGK